MMRFTAFTLLLLTTGVATSHANNVKQTLGFQGYLQNPSTEPVADGSYQMKFSIKKSGTQVWSETISSVTVVNGQFGVILGKTTVLSSNVFTLTAPSETLVIDVEVDLDADGTYDESFSGLPLHSAPTALVAQTALGLDPAADLPAGSVGSSQIASGAIVSAHIAPASIHDSHIVANSIQLNKLNPSGATAGDVLLFDGTQWLPESASGGTGGSGNLSNNCTVSSVQNNPVTTLTASCAAPKIAVAGGGSCEDANLVGSYPVSSFGTNSPLGTEWKVECSLSTTVRAYVVCCD